MKNLAPKKKSIMEKPTEDRAQKKQRSKQKEEQSSEVSTRKQQKAERKKRKKPRRRAFPIWLRIIVVLLLCALALVLGAMVGYGIIGNGKPTDVFDMGTWRHIVEIVTKTE